MSKSPDEQIDRLLESGEVYLSGREKEEAERLVQEARARKLPAGGPWFMWEWSSYVVFLATPWTRYNPSRCSEPRLTLDRRVNPPCPHCAGTNPDCTYATGPKWDLRWGAPPTAKMP
jgi:hypothetical protein